MHDLIVATTNQGKFREIKELLAGQFTSFYSLLDFKDGYTVVEDQPSYAENAWKKARKIGNRFGIDTLADDSGLEVDALQGGPESIRHATARQTQRESTGSWLSSTGLSSKAEELSSKHILPFTCQAEGRGYFFYGSIRGLIGLERQGQGGFGFDPVFCIPEMGKYMAELTVEEKNRISHRGKALAAFSNFLKRGLQAPPNQ